MGMLDGVSQCWWLSRYCIVNWDAWAAIATAVGVCTALAAPWLRDMAFRRKANAIFSLAYIHELKRVAAVLHNFETAFPYGSGSVFQREAEMSFGFDLTSRADFQALTEQLAMTTGYDVDLSKWPSVSITLAYKVASALHAVVRFEHGAQIGNTIKSDGNWSDFWGLYYWALKEAQRELNEAIHAVEAWTTDDRRASVPLE
ncbi:hypothetical protein C9397_14425 [Xanthomonas vasicola pv. vasculorum]|uniref:DUF4760 domain-containing protein n=1 Tax=Xanthomonas vasicola TaxID=56459 RepID=A0ABD7SG26_XANVA|nr:hypothetical protein [Xanthomonas vasicola]AZM72875.1 hypothetical protein CXP37_20825 [Xanthomonas vasicola pv. vasculorum]KGR39059.1 hypothetical protein NX05_19320 [Xanthomonas vasicola]KGR59350.1 hypothetical protein NX79_15310 [Xanthomonas vasicola]MDO6972903.1 hypothetical protein [Xanthomonas vasicola]MDO6986435.1 hypothetical protein [Xanthomonas vasicola]